MLSSMLHTRPVFNPECVGILPTELRVKFHLVIRIGPPMVSMIFSKILDPIPFLS